MNSSTVTFADAVKLLGVSLDSTNVVRACTYHARALQHIRPLLTVDAAKTIASAIVGARLDYCNSLLLGTSEYNLDRLQRVQNRLAHVVLPFLAGATEARRELHWLPVIQRITFKLATITYKARRSGQPVYLTNSLHKYLPTRNPRSASALLLQQPPATTVFSSRASPVAAPSVWNSLNILTQLKLSLPSKVD